MPNLLVCVCVCVTRKHIGLGTLKWNLWNLGYDLKYFETFCTLLIKDVLLSVAIMMW